jgi:hypothetical protein
VLFLPRKITNGDKFWTFSDATMGMPKVSIRQRRLCRTLAFSSILNVCEEGTPNSAERDSGAEVPPWVAVTTDFRGHDFPLLLIKIRSSPSACSIQLVFRSSDVNHRRRRHIEFVYHSSRDLSPNRIRKDVTKTNGARVDAAYL